MILDYYCPLCAPDRDPTREIITVFWCDEHRPDTSGPDDHLVTAHATTGPEMDGRESAHACGVIHHQG
jgi:hypothetical protein